MSEEIRVLLPKLGESILSATIVQWFKKIGDQVHLDEPLLEVSTDKVNSEIPSPVEGVLKEIHAHPDQELQVGDLIAVIALKTASVKPSSPQVVEHQAGAQAEGQGANNFFSPALLRLARENGVSLDLLSQISGTGMGGRVTRNDLEAYIEKKKEKKEALKEPICPLRSKTPSSTQEIERLKMSGMRKAIAENMVRSFYGAPHASLVTEVDVTNVLKLIQKEKEAFLHQHGCKLTITAFVAHAIKTALKDYPLLNSSLEEDTILVKRFINLGIAVSIDQGLVVPVIKHMEGCNVAMVAKEISDISMKARSGKLHPDDVKEGTITLTNFGMSGVQIGIPIIRYPEVAILGMGAIYKRVVPLEEDILAVRSMMHICLTFDHRVLDGMYGCGFLGSVKKHLEEHLCIN